MGSSCSYLLPKQDGGTSHIYVNPTQFLGQMNHPVDGTTNEEPSTNEDTSMSLPIECDIFLEPAQNFEKPEKTYAQLIAEALMQSVDGILAPRDICSCISQKYPYYDMNTRSWMKCVTSTLNSNPIFRSHAKDDDGRSYLWMIDDGAKGENREAIQQRKSNLGDFWGHLHDSFCSSLWIQCLSDIVTITL